MFLRSSDGVDVAVSDLGGNGPDHLLISHATGFHGPVYKPLADALADRFATVAFDYRGHGDTVTPPEALDGSITGVRYDWTHYTDDSLVVARHVREHSDPLVGFGHSMGGAALLMAVHRDPSLFRCLILFEPIVFPPDAYRAASEGNPMAGAARRRRRTFDSYEAAITNFSSKPPLSAFTPEALELYVRHGFALGEDGRVHLKCLPETEAGTFEGSGGHPTWDLLPEIDVPVLVLAGEVDGGVGPAVVAPRIAERLPNGRYEGHPEIDHMGPMTHPHEVAALITAFVDSVG